MDSILPTSDQIDTLKKSTRTLKGTLSYILVICIMLLPSILGISNSYKLDKVITNQEQTQKQSQNQEQKQSTNIEVGSISPSIPDSSSFATTKNSGFRIDEWYTDSYQEESEYLCSLDKKSKYWSIWSKNSFPIAGNEITMRVLLKPQPDNHQTFVVAMGSYKPKFSPRFLFQLNIFENDYKSVRIYGSNTGDALDQDRLEFEPDITKDIIATIGLRTPSKDSNQLIVTLSLEYLPTDGGSKKTFTSKAFSVNTQHVDLEDGVTSQIGIGTSKKGCFKISSFSTK